MTVVRTNQRTEACPPAPEALYSGAVIEKGPKLSETGNSDTDLVAAVGAGDMNALGELVSRHQQKIQGLAYRTLGRWDLAEDVAQEVFLRVCRSAHNYRPTAKVTTWLYRIAVNLCFDTLRRARGRPVELPSEEALPVAAARDPLAAAERTEMIRRAVACLPDRQRAALNLHQYEGLSHREITEVTGWSQSAVESLLVRAYASLRISLAGLETM